MTYSLASKDDAASKTGNLVELRVLEKIRLWEVDEKIAVLHIW